MSREFEKITMHVDTPATYRVHRRWHTGDLVDRFSFFFLHSFDSVVQVVSKSINTCVNTATNVC